MVVYQKLNINGLTVCVDYADRFAETAGRWHSGLETLTVITTPDDVDTVSVANWHGCRVYQTDVFYRGGASFNKGAAIEAGRLLVPWSDWVLFFDPDIMPPVDWHQRICEKSPMPGNLYGCHRREDGKRVSGDAVGVGFFQLFHSDDPRVLATDGEDLVETHWTHAGNYDNAFMHRWPNEQIRDIGFDVQHIGERGNWWGLASDMTVDQMQRQRNRNNGSKEHEKIEKDR